MNNSSKDKKSSKPLSITFYTKQNAKCPVCGAEFGREELLSGGGRLIAGDLTDELRRTYQPSAKYGTVYPLIYSVGVCPECYTAMLWNDFVSFNDPESASLLMQTSDERQKSVNAVFPHADFTKDRTLLEGCASYYYALLCYEKLPPEYSPTIRKAIICLRLAWLCDDMNKLLPERNYDYMSQVFHKKASFFYTEALNLEMEHKESISEIGSLGPDLDKNYGYDGAIYLSCLLEYKYGQTVDINARMNKLALNKSSIARIFGLGKSSKAKPGPLLEHSRNLYDTLTKTLKEAHVVGIDLDED
ncbi:MAG: DUF2225 domain-containing protein [Treponemataceae bacterium]|nr:DUF2225 domain-containing protein [Treponemataceae bacterium]